MGNSPSEVISLTTLVTNLLSNLSATHSKLRHQHMVDALNVETQKSASIDWVCKLFYGEKTFCVGELAYRQVDNEPTATQLPVYQKPVTTYKQSTKERSDKLHTVKWVTFEKFKATYFNNIDSCRRTIGYKKY